MYNLFLEDCDLLEAVEIMNLLNESYIEESVKLDKNRLDDMDYVKSIINQIKNNRSKKETTVNILMFFGAFTAMTIIGLPLGILIIYLATYILSNLDKVELRDLEKVNKTIEKSIIDLNKQYKSSLDKNEKMELKNTINKLEKINKEITISMDKIKNPSKYKKKDKDAIQSLDICTSRIKELLLTPKYSDLKNAIMIDVKITGDKLYNDFLYGDEPCLEIAEYDTDKLNKLIDEGKYDDWSDIVDFMREFINDVNKSLQGKYEFDFSDDSDMWRGGFWLVSKSWNNHKKNKG